MRNIAELFTVDYVTKGFNCKYRCKFMCSELLVNFKRLVLRRWLGKDRPVYWYFQGIASAWWVYWGLWRLPLLKRLDITDSLLSVSIIRAGYISELYGGGMAVELCWEEDHAGDNLGVHLQGVDSASITWYLYLRALSGEYRILSLIEFLRKDIN